MCKHHVGLGAPWGTWFPPCGWPPPMGLSLTHQRQGGAHKGPGHKGPRCKLRLTAIPPGIIPPCAKASPPAFAESSPMSSRCNEGPVLFPSLVLDCAMAACL